MKTKNTPILIIAPLLIVSLASCGNTEPTPSISEGSAIEETFKKLQSSITGSGTVNIKIYESATSATPLQTQNSVVTTQIDDAHYYSFEMLEEKKSYEIYCSYSDDGYVIDDTINVNNEVVHTKSDILKSESYYLNPFSKVTSVDFIKSEDDPSIYKFNGTDDQKSVFEGAFGGYGSIIKTLTIKLENNNFSHLYMSTGIYEDENYGSYMSFDYDILLSNLGTTNAKIIAPYSHVAEHENLKTALNELKNNNYTVLMDDYNEDEDVHSLSTYKVNSDKLSIETDEILGSDSEVTHITTGTFDDGSTSKNYNIYQNKIYETSANNFKTSELYPTIEFAPELFNYDGNGVYSLNYGLAEQVAPLLSFDQLSAFADESSVNIELDSTNAHIKAISYSYNLLGFLVGDVTLTYSNIASTTISLDFSTISKASNWAQQSLAIDGSLRSFIGDYAEVLPYYNCGAEWVDNSYSSEQLNFTTSGNAMDTATLQNNYADLLLAAGYIKGTTTGDYTTYTNATAKLSVDIGIYDDLELDIYISKIS
jgi:hypothetical protein